MVEKDVLLGCSGGMHLTPAGTISEAAMQFRCHSELVIGEKTYNLRSMLSVLSAQAACGGEAILRCDGTDEDDAARRLAQILEESSTTKKE